jgi:hypothetical protein
MATVNTVSTTPGAALTSLYTCPTGKRAAIRYLSVANIDGSAKTFRLAISPDGATIANSHYLAYGASIPANEYVSLSGMVLGAGDIVRVYGEDANVQFWLSVYEDDA